MSKIRIYGDTSGYIDVAAPATADNSTLDLSTVAKTNASNSLAGNQGVNVSSPQYPLDITHVGGNLNQTPMIHLKQDSDGCRNAIELESSTTADKNIGICFKNQSTEKGGVAYNQNNIVSLYAGPTGSWTQGVVVTNPGYVTMPYQPVMAGMDSNTLNVTSYGGGDLTSSFPFFDSVLTNNGNHFNASTGRFTCPVDGVYEMFMRVTATGKVNVRFYHNGNRRAEMYGEPTFLTSETASVLVNCSANDYLYWGVADFNKLGSTQHCFYYIRLVG